MNWSFLSQMFNRVARPGRRPKHTVLRRANPTCFRPSLETLEDRLVLDTAFWSAAVSGNWSDGSKWSTGHAPTVGDTAEI
jgi:hypothetical protein